MACRTVHSVTARPAGIAEVRRPLRMNRGQMATKLQPPGAGGNPPAVPPGLAEEQRQNVLAPLRIVWTTPNGPGGSGGIDTLTRLVTSAVAGERPRRATISCLTTKGRWGITVGACVFAHALTRFTLLAWRGDVDLLHINVAAYGSAYRKIILARLARWLGVPYIIHIHTGRFGEFWDSAGGYVSAALTSFFAHSSTVIVLGQPFARMLTRKLSQLEGKVQILANTTAQRRATPPQVARKAHVQITTIGFMGPNKNTILLIEALKVLDGRTDWYATIAGNGDVAGARACVQRLGLANRVGLPGRIDHAAVQELLARTDIFVLPSRSEGMPMSILEAHSYGIPVVATPVGAIVDVVRHEQNGLLVPVNDLQALVRALRRLLEDGELRRALGAQAARDHSARYTLQAYIERISHIWRAATQLRKLG